jgi:hypothetical protein
MKEQLLSGFEIVTDEDSSPYFKQQPKVLMAENSIIFDYFYSTIIQRLYSISMAFSMILNFQSTVNEDEKI